VYQHQAAISWLNTKSFDGKPANTKETTRTPERSGVFSHQGEFEMTASPAPAAPVNTKVSPKVAFEELLSGAWQVREDTKYIHDHFVDLFDLRDIKDDPSLRGRGVA